MLGALWASTLLRTVILQTPKTWDARLWASTLLRTIISKNLINDGNKKALTLLGHGQKKSPFGDLLNLFSVFVG